MLPSSRSATEKTLLVSAICSICIGRRAAGLAHDRIKGDCDGFSNQFNHVYSVVSDLGITTQEHGQRFHSFHFVRSLNTNTTLLLLLLRCSIQFHVIA